MAGAKELQESGDINFHCAACKFDVCAECAGEEEWTRPQAKLKSMTQPSRPEQKPQPPQVQAQHRSLDKLTCSRIRNKFWGFDLFRQSHAMMVVSPGQLPTGYSSIYCDICGEFDATAFLDACKISVMP